LSEEASAIGAVNTVVRSGDELVGYNTDAAGFLRALRALGFQPKGKSAVLLGAGGSAKAVAWALADAGVKRLTILNRSVTRASALARRIRSQGGPVVGVGPLASAREGDVVSGAALVVNCTSLGLDGRSLPPVAFSSTGESCLFYDLVYGTRATPFVRAARRAGRRAGDGLGMLLEQAGLAFRLWTGRPPPLEVMARALRG
jgi:shikimate dehydrogenase